MEQTSTVIKKTGIFDRVDTLYGDPLGGEGEDTGGDTGGDMGGDTGGFGDGFGSDLAGGMEAAADTEAVFVQIDGVVDNLTGLTTGATYYLDATAGTISTSGEFLKIGLGSPVRDEYAVIGQGFEVWELGAGEKVYKKGFIRYLPNGSLDRE